MNDGSNCCVGVTVGDLVYNKTVCCIAGNCSHRDKIH